MSWLQLDTPSAKRRFMAPLLKKKLQGGAARHPSHSRSRLGHMALVLDPFAQKSKPCLLEVGTHYLVLALFSSLAFSALGTTFF